MFKRFFTKCVDPPATSKQNMYQVALFALREEQKQRSKPASFGIFFSKATAKFCPQQQPPHFCSIFVCLPATPELEGGEESLEGEGGISLAFACFLLKSVSFLSGGGIYDLLGVLAWLPSLHPPSRAYMGLNNGYPRLHGLPTDALD